jgi:hypothetical protein
MGSSIKTSKKLDRNFKREAERKTRRRKSEKHP